MAPQSESSNNVKASIHSIPNLKYPSKRDVLPKNGTTWLEGKRIDDAVGDYWRIHDKIYDLSDFISKHPGGKFWLESTRGTDITEAFEAHHLNPAVLKIVPKYYIKDAETPRNSPYTFEENGFYKTLRKKVWKIIAKEGSGPTFQMKLMQDCLVATFVVTLLLAAYFRSYTIAIVAGIELNFLMGMSHSFFHQADNFRMYYWDLSPLSSEEWRITHAMSHHLYTNTLLDIEIATLEPFMCFLPDPKKSLLSRILMPISLHTIVFILFHLDVLMRFFSYLTGRKKLKIENTLPLFELIAMIILAGEISLGCKLFSTMIATAGGIIYYLALTGPHHHPDIYHANDKFREQPDWGLCQLDAVRDRVENTGNLFLSSTTFGDHTLHHLFPTIDQSKLPLLYPVFLETCKEFNIPFTFHKTSYLWSGTFRQLVSTTPNPNPPGYKHTDEKFIPDCILEKIETQTKQK